MVFVVILFVAASHMGTLTALQPTRMAAVCVFTVQLVFLVTVEIIEFVRVLIPMRTMRTVVVVGVVTASTAAIAIPMAGRQDTFPRKLRQQRQKVTGAAVIAVNVTRLTKIINHCVRGLSR